MTTLITTNSNSNSNNRKSPWFDFPRVAVALLLQTTSSILLSFLLVYVFLFINNEDGSNDDDGGNHKNGVTFWTVLKILLSLSILVVLCGSLVYLLDHIGNCLGLWRQRGDGCRSWFDGTYGIFTIATVLIAGCATVYSWLIFYVWSLYVSDNPVVLAILLIPSNIIFAATTIKTFYNVAYKTNWYGLVHPREDTSLNERAYHTVQSSGDKTNDVEGQKASDDSTASDEEALIVDGIPITTTTRTTAATSFQQQLAIFRGFCSLLLIVIFSILPEALVHLEISMLGLEYPSVPILLMIAANIAAISICVASLYFLDYFTEKLRYWPDIPTPSNQTPATRTTSILYTIIIGICAVMTFGGLVFVFVIYCVLNNWPVAVDAPEYIHLLVTTMNIYLGINTVAAFVVAGRKTQWFGLGEIWRSEPTQG